MAQTDIFSFGAVFCELLTGKQLLEITKKDEYKTTENPISNIQGMTTNFYQSLSNCLQTSPNLRPTTTDLLKDQCFSTVSVKILRYLDMMVIKDPKDKLVFFRGLPKVINSFSKNLLEVKIIPLLVEECHVDKQFAPILHPTIFQTCKYFNIETFTKQILDTDPPEILPIKILQKSEPPIEKTDPNTQEQRILPDKEIVLKGSDTPTMEYPMSLAQEIVSSQNYMKSTLRSVFEHLKSLGLTDDIIPLSNLMIKYLLKYERMYPHHNQIKTIEESLNNIKNNQKFTSNEQLLLYKKDITNTFTAIKIYTKFMIQTQNKQCQIIEQKLFDISFIPYDNNETKILPIYLLHDDLIEATDSIHSLKSSTGSGKTRCAPFLFAIKALNSNLKQPFFLMTQPSTSIIKDKIEDFNNILGDSVVLIGNDYNQFQQYYFNVTKRKYSENKPIVALFTPHNMAKLISKNKNIFKYARFVLDEIHERSVETDVITALLAKELKNTRIPLQLLMMTATPDIRILNLFQEPKAKKIDLADSLLFHIEDIPREVSDFNKLDETAKDEAIKIISRMESKQIQLGHILIFTSGNRRINNISELIKRNIKQLPQTVRLIRTTEKSFKNKKVFYENLDEQIKNDNNSIFIILMKYAGFLSNEEKEIGKSPIPNHPNVIKIIIATNAIESSITIDGLSAVIDCGIFNQPVLDKNKGISKLEESPISVQSQTQRRGRVGRKRDGIYVQMTIRNHPPVQLISPAIEKEDISPDILSLRRIGIKLEEIENLPEPGVKPSMMRMYLNELKSYGALDNKGDLTQTGEQIQNFTSLLPYISISILEVAQRIKGDENMAKIVGALVFHILSTKDLYVDPLSKTFRKNFDPDSDIITLLKSIIEVMQKGGNRKYNLAISGFNSKIALQLIGNIEQTANNFLNTKESLWNEISKFCNKYDMMQFIQLIVKEIENHRREWVSCRRAEYFTVSDVLNEYKIIYHGNSSLDESNESINEIRLNMRPGATGLATPGSCFIFQITKGNNDIFYGSIVHRNTSLKEICHPLIVKVPIIMNNQFTRPLIEAYLGENAQLFRPFQKTKQYKETNHGGFICYPEQFDSTCSIISYAPKNTNDKRSIKIMTESIQKVISLMQFTPRTILIRNDVLKALVAITSVGTHNFSTKIIYYTDTKTFAYQIDKVTIDYMIKNINEMKNIDGHLSIAMTGEKFIYSIEDEDFLGIPITWPTVKSVFGTNPLFYSHLVLISDKVIPNATRLSWVDPSISVTYSDVDALVHIANTMYRNVVSVSHNFDFLYTMTKDAKVQVSGNLPIFRGITQESDVHRPIGRMFDLYAMKCIKNESLIHDVELDDFNLTGNVHAENLKSDIITMNGVKRLYGNDFDLESWFNKIPREIKQISYQINRLISRRKEINDKWDICCNNPQLRKQIIAETKQIKADLSILNQQFDNFCRNNKLQKKLIINVINIRTPIEVLLTKDLYVFPNYIRAIPRVDDVEFTINKINGYRDDLNVEILPRCEVTIYHRKNNRFNERQFISSIDQVCKRFGKVVFSKRDYIQFNYNNKYSKGKINVILNGGDFVIPFVGEIRKSIGFGDKVPLKIPYGIVPFCIRYRENVIKAINDWINLFHLKLQPAGPMFIGSSEEVQRARELLSSNNAKPEIPYKSYTIPGGISIPHVVSLVNKKNRSLSNNKKWAVDKQSDLSNRFLIVPDDVEDSAVDAFYKQVRNKSGNQHNIDDVILYDYIYCCGSEEATLSGSQIPLFNEDGSFVCHNFCTTCAYDILLYAVGNLFDQEDCQPRMDLLIGNVEKIKTIPPLGDNSSGNNNDQWPSIPLGQLLWCLISEPKLSAVLKTWFSAVVYQALHSFFEYCPDHPTILLRPMKGKILRCSHLDCGMFLCPSCKKWHKENECNLRPELPMGFRLCPNCKRPVEKTQDCNHISCSCGKHFCYFCGWGPTDDRKLVYNHMSREHGGCFNDPPDYKRMRGINVSNEEIEAFYKKYPDLRPKTYSSSKIKNNNLFRFRK